MNVTTTVPATASGGQCLPTNDALSGPLGGFIDFLTGALGGLAPYLSLLMGVVLGLGVILLIMSDKGSRFMKLVVIVLLIPSALVLLIAGSQAIYRGFNGIC